MQKSNHYNRPGHFIALRPHPALWLCVQLTWIAFILKVTPIFFSIYTQACLYACATSQPCQFRPLQQSQVLMWALGKINCPALHYKQFPISSSQVLISLLWSILLENMMQVSLWSSLAGLYSYSLYAIHATKTSLERMLARLCRFTARGTLRQAFKPGPS